MEINVSGRKINVGAALTQHIEDRLQTISEKYFSRSIDANVTATKEGHLYRFDVSMHANQGINLQGRGEDDDPYSAFENAAMRVEKQLRRYKRRLKNHHNVATKDYEAERVPYSVLAPVGVEADGENESQEDQPLIIAETHKEIPTVAVGDAVMLMDLANSNVFMFRNAKNKALEVVYKREDGNIGWISPD